MSDKSRKPPIAPGVTPLETPCRLLDLRIWLKSVDILGPGADQEATSEEAAGQEETRQEEARKKGAGQEETGEEESRSSRPLTIVGLCRNIG